MTILLLSLFLFLFLGVPIAYSLGLSALCYFVVHEPGLMVVMPQRLMAGMDSYALIALPLFIFMGQLMNASGITRRLIDYCMLLVGRLSVQIPRSCLMLKCIKLCKPVWWMGRIMHLPIFGISRFTRFPNI